MNKGKGKILLVDSNVDDSPNSLFNLIENEDML